MLATLHKCQKYNLKMSEYDRNKYYRRKFYQTQRDGSHSSHGGYTRPYNKNTLFKYDREYKETDKSNENKEKTIQQPTILQKARTERSVSPKRSKEPEPTPTAIQNHETIAAPPPTMTESIKLIEDGAIVFETIQDYLQDSPDFLVVGVLGCHGVGKSTIMNLIAHNNLTEQLKQDLFNYNPTSDTSEAVKILTENVANIKVCSEEIKEQNTHKKESIIFKPQSLDQIDVGTNGVDLFVTNNRVFLLDCQPVISAAVLEEIVQNDSKRSITGEYLPVENCAEIQSLQLATFILSVCHVVILVQDWFLDSNFVRFLHTAEMLKPSIPVAEEDFMEYFPHIILVHNRATLEDFTPMRFKLIQKVYRDVFSNSKLRFESGMGLGTGKIIHSLCPQTCGEPLNLFLLPEYDEDDETIMYRGHPPFDDLVKELRAQIHSVTRIPLLSAQLTEKNWLQFSARVWDTIKKSSFFLEYSKLMP